MQGSKPRRPLRHTEHHRASRIGWLRAAVLGANDGIVSTGSLILGVAAAGASHGSILVTGIAGLVAGAMSMAAGEYVSVHSQADTEKSDLARERAELAEDPAAEHVELTNIYVSRGLEHGLAQEVANQLMAKDALGAHARDELGISNELRARPIQAALASAASFSAGAALPLLVWGTEPTARYQALARGDIVGFPCFPGRACSEDRRCAHVECRMARDILGGIGDGNHGRRGRNVPRSGIGSGLARVLIRLFCPEVDGHTPS